MGLVSRRRFLGSAAAVPLAFQARVAGVMASASPINTQVRDGCLLLDSGANCILQESLAGFARGFEAASVPYRRVTVADITEVHPDTEAARLIVVPGARLQSSEFAGALNRLARRGSTVVYESGAAYASPEAFRIEQALLQTHFGLRVEAPLDLWPATPGNTTLLALNQKRGPLRRPHAATSPYVHYDWPCKAMVRDFSRAIPVSSSAMTFSDEAHPTSESAHAAQHQAIARLGDRAVSCRLRLAEGELIFLGSPLGPHLGAGDREAQVLLEGFEI